MAVYGCDCPAFTRLAFAHSKNTGIATSRDLSHVRLSSDNSPDARYAQAFNSRNAVPSFASVSSVSRCQICLQAFTHVLKMPELWWSNWCQRSNGYFGYETTQHSGTVSGYSAYTSHKYCLRMSPC